MHFFFSHFDVVFKLSNITYNIVTYWKEEESGQRCGHHKMPLWLRLWEMFLICWGLNTSLLPWCGHCLYLWLTVNVPCATTTTQYKSQFYKVLNTRSCTHLPVFNIYMKKTWKEILINVYITELISRSEAQHGRSGNPQQDYHANRQYMHPAIPMMGKCITFKSISLSVYAL